jgi:hypothetical protein
MNALLEKIGDGNRGEITISWMVKPVTAIRIHPPRIAAKCCSFVSEGIDPAAHAACPSRDRDIDDGARRALAGSHRREED